jgi:hypothetical protein
MFDLKQTKETNISIDCVKTCPYEPALVAMAYYQTNPTTVGALSVTHLLGPEDLTLIQTLECPPLLHLVWSTSLRHPGCFLLVAASRTNDVLFYLYDPSTRKLSLLKVLSVGENVFCLYLDLLTNQSCH